MNYAKFMSECNQVQIDIETITSELRVIIDKALLDLDRNKKKLQDLAIQVSAADRMNIIAGVQKENFELHFVIAKMSSVLDRQ